MPVFSAVGAAHRAEPVEGQDDPGPASIAAESIMCIARNAITRMIRKRGVFREPLEFALAGRFLHAGYVAGTEVAARMAPRRKLTGILYFTDALRAVAILGESGEPDFP